MPDDDRAVLERLAALEAEVKADADAQRVRKEAAMAKVRAERDKQLAEREELRSRQAQLVTRKPREESRPRHDEEIDHGELGGALELAGKANRVRGELARKPGKGEKSWIKSGIASTALGPIGWLYAGSLREAVPAATAWLLIMLLVSKIGIGGFLLWPVLMVALPLSGLAGVLYALSYNRHGGRQRLFGDKDKKLPAAKARELKSGDR
ncbi:MAG TPA: hypothetical protein VIV11_09990 [Kofleriaceae bacterium]